MRAPSASALVTVGIPFFCAWSHFRIFQRDRSGVDNQICAFDIFCAVTFVYGNSAGLQMFCHLGHLDVGSGNGVSAGSEDLRHRAETDSADPDAVDMFVLTDI